LFEMTRLGTTGASGSGKRAVWIASAAVLALLLVLGFFFRHFLLSGLDLVAEGTGSRTSAALCLVGALLVLALLLVWLLFPIFMYFGLRDLRRRTAELDRTMKLCAQRLTRANAEPIAQKVEDTPEQKGPGNSSV
jgi:hypothetical protein